MMSYNCIFLWFWFNEADWFDSESKLKILWMRLKGDFFELILNGEWFLKLFYEKLKIQWRNLNWETNDNLKTFYQILNFNYLIDFKK